MKTLIIVPDFNESQTMGKVIEDLRSWGFNDIVVVDDGSADDSGKIAGKKGAVVLRHIANRGLGAALGTGFEYARQKSYDCAVTFDSDGQHRAEDIGKLVKVVAAGKGDVVIGSRLLRNMKDMPKDRLILNLLSNLATFIVYGVWATDTLSGLRAFNRRALETIQIKTDRMEVSNEFFKEIRRNNLKYREVAVRPIYTDYSRTGEQPDSNWAANGFKMILRLFR